MNFRQATNYLISLNNIPHKEYLKDKKDAGIYLKRLGYFLSLLGNPEQKIPHYIHITGTSGKGSVAIMLESILRAAGKKTGLTTSPHPSAITERWEINGKEMRDADFVSLVKSVKPKLDEYTKCSPYDFLSFFEIITALGLWHFAKNHVEWAVIEVGLGGRYDSTNIIPRKDIAIITNIGRDHLNLIGPTLADVAREKAGIIKSGCNVFTMEENPKLLRIINGECKKQKVKLNIIKPNKYTIQKEDLRSMIFIYKKIKYELPVLGKHQIKNAILAIETARELKIPDKAIRAGLSDIALPLRMEIISRKPMIILDGAHNPDKMATTVKTINYIVSNNRINNIHLIIGFSADKDTAMMLRQLALLKPKTVTCARSTANPLRAPADPIDIKNAFQRILPKTRIQIVSDPSTAFRRIKQIMNKNDLLLVTGSFFLSGEIRKIGLKKSDNVKPI